MFFIPPSRLLAPGDDVDEYHDNGNDQQDVNKPAHRVTGHQAQQPQND